VYGIKSTVYVVSTHKPIPPEKKTLKKIGFPFEGPEAFYVFVLRVSAGQNM
jgi:hypothetical protein